MNDAHETEALDYRDADYFLDAASQDAALADLEMLARYNLGVGETACMPAYRTYLRHPC